MVKEKVFSLFVVCLVGFIGLFCKIDFRTDNFISSNFIEINGVYATTENQSLYSDNYEYNENGGRTNKKDDTLDDRTSAAEGAEWISVIPGVGTFVTGFNYLGYTIEKFDFIKLVDMIKGNFINNAMMVVGNIGNLLNPNPDEATAAVGFDKMFMSNLYCGAQRLYEEDKSLISKSNDVKDGGLGYPIFPIYPLSIGINRRTGLCDLDLTTADKTKCIKNQGESEYEEKCIVYENSIVDNHQFDDYFKKINLAKGSARKTKCAFSYSPTSQQCIEKLTNPMLISYEAQSIVVAASCLAQSMKDFKTQKNSAEMWDEITEAAENNKKWAQEAFDEAKDKADEATAKLAELKKKGITSGPEYNEALDNAAKAQEAAKKAEDNLNNWAEAVENAKEKTDEYKKLAAQSAVRNEKHSEDIGTAVLEFFTDERMIYDPVSLLGILTVGFTLQFLADSISAIIPNILNPPAIVEELICVAAGVAGFEVFKGVSEAVIEGIGVTNYKNAKKAIKNYNFCGYDWLTYQETADGKYYKKGVYPHSYYKKVYDCINAVENGSECGAIADDYACSSTDTKFCFEGKDGEDSKITKYSRHVKNRVFREYIYSGREYDAGTIEQDITDEKKNTSDNRFVRFFKNLPKNVSEAVTGQSADMSSLFSGGNYDADLCIDPRTPDQKGFETLTQRYYMRGNEKANFACSRFVYDGNSACILHTSKVLDEDKGEMKKNYNNTYYLLPDNNKELINKYSKACKEMFTGARECCKQRSRHLICLENKAKGSSKFCFSNVVSEYSAENIVGGSNLMQFVNAVQNQGDFFKWTCELDGVKFEASKKEGTNHVCVFSYGLCPYDFKLNAGLNYKATYCDADYYYDGLDANKVLKRTTTHFNVDDCRKGIFGADTREEYKENSIEDKKFISHVFNEVYGDMNGFNDDDFRTIYDHSLLDKVVSGGYKDVSNDEMLLLKNMFGCDERFEASCKEIITNTITYGYTISDKYDGVNKVINKYDVGQDFINNFRTSAYGQIKNFCQYMAHCVEVEEERLIPQASTYTTLFMDSSCNAGATNNSRNLFQGNTGGLPKQLSAPIVECIHESLNNLVNGVSGNSMCTEGHEVNNDGFCDSDTAESVAEAIKTNNTQFLKKYDVAPESDTPIIKGYPLPDMYNPFLRIQKYFIRVIKAALSLFLVAYFYKLFFSGKIGDFTSPDNMVKLVFNLFKFSIVIWLIFYNGWQQGIYKRIVNFSVDAYTFVNNNFSKAISTPNNQILHLEYPKTINIFKQDPIDADKLVNYRVCYKYDYANNIKFGAVNETRGVCERGYRRKDTSEILVKARGRSESKSDQNETRLVISSNQEIAALIAFIDEYNSTHSDKLTTSGLEGLNKSFTDEYLNSGEYEKEYIWNKYYDGCYFDPSEYKEGRSYLSIFDTLDCKMIRYLGYSTDKMVPNLIIFSLMLVIPNYLFEGTFVAKIITGLGSMLFGALMSFMFIMFNVVIKTVYMFLSSFFTLSILIFVSPVILPLMFYERTKKMVDTWLGMIMDSIIKPVFNLSTMMIYVNIMDKILLKGAIFIKHDFRGRGPSLYCYEGAISSFVCVVNSLLNGMGGTGFFALLNRLFNNFLPFLADVLIVVLLFMMSDSVLSTIDTIVKSIFQLGKSAAVSNMSGKGSVAGSESKSMVGKGSVMESAMKTGESINDFRANYLAKAPGAAIDSFINATTRGGADIYGKKLGKGGNYLKYDSVKNAKGGWNKFTTGAGNVGRFITNGGIAIGRGALHVGSTLGKARNFANNVDDWARNISTRGKDAVKEGLENASKRSSNNMTRLNNWISSFENKRLDRKYKEEAKSTANEINKLDNREDLSKKEQRKLKKLKNKYKRYQKKIKENQEKLDKMRKGLFKFTTDYDEDVLRKNKLILEEERAEEERKKKAKTSQVNREDDNERSSEVQQTTSSKDNPAESKNTKNENIDDKNETNEEIEFVYEDEEEKNDNNSEDEENDK